MSKLIFALALLLLSCITNAQVIDIPHSGESPTRTLLAAVSKPRAVVLLFPGGGGMAVISDSGAVKSKHTFVRSLDLWAQYGINAVLVDSPYDLGDLRRGNLRGRDDHLSRVDEVVSFYKKKFDLPVWIFGHSMGSSTVTYYANEISRSKGKLRGIIIAGTINSASLDDEVSIPVLGIHHEGDACAGTPLAASRRVIEGRPAQYVSRLEIIEGGISEGNICDSFAYHGFNQTESEFIKSAAQFILSN